MNTCKECKQLKKVEEFVKDKRNPRGYTNICKPCRNKMNRDYKIKTGKLKLKPKSSSVKNKICSKCEKEKTLDLFYNCSKDVGTGKTSQCKVCINEYSKKHKSKRYVKDRANELQKIRVRKYPERIKKIRKKCYKKRRNDPLKKSLDRLRVNINNSIRKKSLYKKDSTEEILGCSIEEAIMHLEHTFVLNYNIPYKEKYLDYLHIDHIIPLSSAKTQKEVYELNHYTNLQLLYSSDNQKKSNFQIVLKSEFPKHLI